MLASVPLLPPCLNWSLLLFLVGPPMPRGGGRRGGASVGPACLNFLPAPGLAGSPSLILPLFPSSVLLTQKEKVEKIWDRRKERGAWRTHCHLQDPVWGAWAARSQHLSGLLCSLEPPGCCCVHVCRCVGGAWGCWGATSGPPFPFILKRPWGAGAHPRVIGNTTCKCRGTREKKRLEEIFLKS